MHMSASQAAVIQQARTGVSAGPCGALGQPGGRAAVDPAACLFGEGQQAGTARDAQVLRDRRLAGSEAASELADCARTP